MNTANLLVACLDKKGLVHSITGFLYEHNANLITLEQHIEDGMFFMRVEWDLADFKLSEENFLNAFHFLQEKYKMDVTAHYNSKKTKLGLFCSHDPHCLVDILMRYQTRGFPIEISFVISNFDDCRSFVENHKIPYYYISTKKGAIDYERKHLEIIRKYDTDLLGFARYMKVVSNDFINQVNQKIINVHHSFLPSFIGSKPYDEAYERGVKMIGATAHYVTPDLDRGPIIEQTIRRISHAHKVKNLKIMGKESEKEVFAFAIKKHIENKVIVYKNRTIVFM